MRLRSLPLIFAPLLVVACIAPPEEPLGSVEEPMKICPGANTLEGIDISHWDGAIDWVKVKASGRAFAFAKATEGTSYVDNTFAANWAGMKQAGVVRSAYHFFHANMDPIAEANHFLQTMGTLEAGDLPPTLDLEVTDSQSAAKITATAIQWLDAVAAATGTTPILYTGPAFVNALGNPAGLENHAQLWIANWGVSCPDVPAPFTAWPFWQYDDKGTVSGIPGASAVDLNKFNGTLAELHALTVQASSSSSSSSSSGGSSSSSGSSSSGGTSSSSSSGTGGTSTTSSSSGGGGGGAGSSSSSSGASSSSGDPNAAGVGGDATAGSPTSTGGCSISDAGDGPRSLMGAWLVALALVGARRRPRVRPARML